MKQASKNKATRQARPDNWPAISQLMGYLGPQPRPAMLLTRRQSKRVSALVFSRKLPAAHNTGAHGHHFYKQTSKE